MFEFEAKFLMKRGYTFTYDRMPDDIIISRRVQNKIEGNLVVDGLPYHHTNGDMPVDVVLDSWYSSDIVASLAKNEGASDADLFSIGSAVPQWQDAFGHTQYMFDKSPLEESKKLRKKGEVVHIKSAIQMERAGLILTTAFIITPEEYEKAIATNNLSVLDWTDLYKKKTGLMWTVTPEEQEEVDRLLAAEEAKPKSKTPEEAARERKEKEMRKKEERKRQSEADRQMTKEQSEKNKKMKIKGNSLLQTRYNSVSEATNMKIAAGRFRGVLVTDEEMVKRMREKGMTEEEIKNCITRMDNAWE